MADNKRSVLEILRDVWEIVSCERQDILERASQRIKGTPTRNDLIFRNREPTLLALDYDLENSRPSLINLEILFNFSQVYSPVKREVATPIVTYLIVSIPEMSWWLHLFLVFSDFHEGPMTWHISVVRITLINLCIWIMEEIAYIWAGHFGTNY